MKQNCLVIAGEKSGEEHCMTFFPELKKLCPETHFWGVGGDDQESLGMELLYHLKDFSSIGFTSVISKIPFYLKALKNLTREAKRRECKTAILIDFQDFNFRLAKRLHKQGVEVLYYVAPQAWAWKEYRAGVLGEIVHTLFTILPFEKKWFKERGVMDVIALKHPLLKRFPDIITSKKDEKVVILLPGSRNLEVKNLLPLFDAAIDKLRVDHDFKVSIVKSSNVEQTLYEPYIPKYDYIYQDLILDHALSKATVGLAASGTVTLAAALYSLPTIVTYKVSKLNWWVFKRLVKYDGPVSLANIVHQERLFPELIQENATIEKIYESLRSLLTDPKECERISEKLQTTYKMLKGDDIDVPEYMAEVIRR